MHCIGVTDPSFQPHGPSQQQRKQLMDLLVAAELQQYHSLLSSQLNVSTTRQLKTVSDEDLIAVVGMSKPEVRRLRRFVKKMAGQSGTLEKIKNILSKSTHDTSDLCCLPVSDGAKSSTSFIIDQSDITISKELGRGSFGSVHGGTWITGSGSKVSIAVRKCRVASSTTQRRDQFLSSTQTIHHLKHLNIIRLFGVSMTNTNFLLIMEHAPTTQSLKSWLQLPQSMVLSGLSSLVEYCKQISSAMLYLENCKFVHGDLSARNVLVFSKDLVKVTDCGLSRILDAEDELVKTVIASSKPQVAWLAPECLEALCPSSFSSPSDVWSFGVTMWEIFSYGTSPSWGSSESSQILASIKSGKLLERPQLCPKDFYYLMLDCWKVDPGQRPSFQQIADRLNKVNLVRLQVENDSVGTRANHLTVKSGDVVAILDSSSSGAPVAGWWKGLNESSNQVGYLNPVNMKVLSHDTPKQSVARQQIGSSNILRRNKSGHQKPKLTAGMISLPLNDLRHTSHVGRNGETFGCDKLPIYQIATPLKDSTNQISDNTKSDSSNSSTKSLTYKPAMANKNRMDDGKTKRSTATTEKPLNGSCRMKDTSPTSDAKASELTSASNGRELSSKLSVGSNLSNTPGDILMRVKYSPSSLSMVSADLSHVTSLVSSDTLTDVSSLPGDLGSLSKSDYEDYDYEDGDEDEDDDETFDVTTDGGDNDHLNDDTLVCSTDNDLRDDDDSPKTIEEPQTPKILETSSSLFDEVMLALGGEGGGRQMNKDKKPSNKNGQHAKIVKRAVFNISSDAEEGIFNHDNDNIDEESEDEVNTGSKVQRGETKSFRSRLASSEPCLEDKQVPSTSTASTSAQHSIVGCTDKEILRLFNGPHQHKSYTNVRDASFTTCSSMSLMSSSSDLKSSDSSLSSDMTTVAHSLYRDSRSMLSKISNALGRPRSKDHQRRLSQASTISRFSIALINSSSQPTDQENSTAKLSSASFSGFEGRRSKPITIDDNPPSLPPQHEKYPSFLANKPKNTKAKDKLRRSSLILASVFGSKRSVADEKHRKPGILPTANFNTNELFFNVLREQEMEIAEKEGESEDSGIVLIQNQSHEMVSSINLSRDDKATLSSEKTAEGGHQGSQGFEQDSATKTLQIGTKTIFSLADLTLNTSGAKTSSDSSVVSKISDDFLQLNRDTNQETANQQRILNRNGLLKYKECNLPNGQFASRGGDNDDDGVVYNLSQRTTSEACLDNGIHQKTNKTFPGKKVPDLQLDIKPQIFVQTNNNNYKLYEGINSKQEATKQKTIKDCDLDGKAEGSRHFTNDSTQNIQQDKYSFPTYNNNRPPMVRTFSSGSESPEVVDV